MMGYLKTFDREEVETLVSNRDWDALRGYDLSYADLSSMDFSGAYLPGVSLRGADLSHADLSRAHLRSVDLTDAVLRYALLSEAVLTNALLRHADLMCAVLIDTSVRYADLTGADLRGADFYESNLYAAILTDAASDEETKWLRMRCPEKGEFIGYKKAYGMSGKPYIVKLLIPGHALRTSATSEKCRCSEAKVLSITKTGGSDTATKTVNSWFDSGFSYTVGETVQVCCFNTDRWYECTPGIHFFMEREEAVEYFHP